MDSSTTLAETFVELADTAEESRLVELLQIQNAEGPCLDANRTGRQVHADSAAGDRAALAPVR